MVCACDRSWMTKLVSPSDVGKAFAFFGLFQAVSPLVSTPIISVIYREASKVMPWYLHLLRPILATQMRRPS